MHVNLLAQRGAAQWAVDAQCKKLDCKKVLCLIGVQILVVGSFWVEYILLWFSQLLWFPSTVKRQAHRVDPVIDWWPV